MKLFKKKSKKETVILKKDKNSAEKETEKFIAETNTNQGIDSDNSEALRTHGPQAEDIVDIKKPRPRNKDKNAERPNIFVRSYLAVLDAHIGKKIAENKLKVLLSAATVLVLLCIIYVIWQNTQIDTSFYQVQSNKVSNNVRVVCLTDLHLKEFGNDNERLVKRIKELEPDIIAMAGDMNTYSNDDYSVVTKLCENLKEVAPIYYSLGNHEYEAWLFKSSKICDDLKNIGVHVLHNESEKVMIGTSTINIGGLSESPKQFEQYGHQFFDKYAESDEFKLLLVHYPEEFQGTMDNYQVDLALCGHAHGGQIRIPKIGGLYSADQGFFPELTDGMHIDEEGGGSTFIVSRGLGNSSWIPRINNRPEIVVADINWY